MGNAVGSPLPIRRYGPVTTDPIKGEATFLSKDKSMDEATRGRFSDEAKA